MSTFITFVLVGNSPSGKTQLMEVRSADDLLLGRISFRGQWRKYVFLPEPNTLFDQSCLEAIGKECANRTFAWRNSLKGRKRDA